MLLKTTIFIVPLLISGYGLEKKLMIFNFAEILSG